MKTHSSSVCVLRGAAAGGRFESWSEMETASNRATHYWNEHKHPFVWGTRKRHRARHRFGLATLPKRTELSGWNTNARIEREFSLKTQLFSFM